MARIAIIGNSAAGFSASGLLRNRAGQEISVISKDACLPYRRSRLIDYLSGQIKEEELFLCGEDFYSGGSITLRKGAEAARLDAKRNRLVLKDNTRIDYDYLLIACGARVELPDLTGKMKEGVFAFYSLDDINRIKERLLIAHSVFIIGGSKSARDLAAALLTKGKEVKVISDSAPQDLFNDTPGIEIIREARPQEFIGEGELEAVKFSNGKVIACSAALFLEPRVPVDGFLKDTGLKAGDGYILVDESMRTNIDNIFACGAVSRRESQSAGHKSWDEAAGEGALAAEAILKTIERG